MKLLGPPPPKSPPLPNPRPQRGVTILYLPSRNCGRLQRYKASKAMRTPPPELPTPVRYLDRSGVFITTTQQPTVEDTGRIYRGCDEPIWYELVVIGLAILGALIAAL